MAKYWQRGESLDYTNPGTDAIRYGDVVPITDKIGVAGCDILPGATGSLHVTGVFIIDKDAEALTVGQEVFWDVSTLNVKSTGTHPAGWVVEPTAAADATAKVKIG
ncbi:MAG: DUF2190 family protein [Oscillospiraceae bacterium]